MEWNHAVLIMAKKEVVEEPREVKEPVYDYDVVYDKEGRIPQFAGKKQKIELLSQTVGKLKSGVKVVRGFRTVKKEKEKIKIIKNRWTRVQ